MVGKILIAAVILLILGAGALTVYGARVTPVTTSHEQVLPDARFPH